MTEQVVEGFSLSAQQRRLWALHAGGTACTTSCAVEVNGALETEALRRALQEIVDQHEILRTSFRTVHRVGTVLQVVSPSKGVELRESDLTTLPPPERKQAIRRLTSEPAREVLDLNARPALAIRVIRLAAERHVLSFDAPAICVDGPSMKGIMRELARRYEAAITGGESPRIDPVQYADFAQWQADINISDAGRDGRGFWEKIESARPELLRLPFESDQPAGAMAVVCSQVGGALLVRLDALARRLGEPLSAILLACWQALLWALSGRPEQLVVDVRMDGRQYEYLQSAVGCFSQHVPVPVVVSPRMTLGRLVERVAAAVREASRWQDFFSRAEVGAIGPVPRAPSVGFDYDEWPGSERVQGVSFNVDNYRSVIEIFKLELACIRRDDRLQLELRYDPGVYTSDAVDALIESLQTLLAAAPDAIGAPIDRAPILSDGQRREVIALARAKETAPEVLVPVRCVHQAISEQAVLRGDQRAVVFEDVALTYRELEARSNRLARYLQRIGVAPDVVVGLLVERSADMIVALLAVLKAGGAYLPIEPTLPEERRRLLLDEAGAQVLITDARAVADSRQDLVVVSLVRDADAIERSSADPVEGGARPENLAYVIFTSGSTGTPKGVAVEHRHLAEYVRAAATRLELDDVRTFATVSTLGADLGNTAIFPALCAGGELHVISQDRASDAGALTSYFRDHPCDLLKIVPSHAAALVAASPAPEAMLPRKRLVLGGENLEWGTLKVLQAHAPECRVFNHYGPTETTVGAVAGRVVPGETGPAYSVPIGSPLQSARLYLLDAHLEPVPLGVAGELFIGGETVARGYINRPELTAERFLPDPLSPMQDGARLYRTGDRARWLPNGTIEFLGRVDRQVKLRGFRIELSEIEAVLRRHSGVRQSVVVLTGKSGYQRLDAYVTRAEGASVSPSELRAHIEAKLPEYMLPANIVVLDHIPRTPNGKIDYAALPAPEQLQERAGRDQPLPRTPTEEIVAGIFQEMLGLAQIGRDDDFFDIGGHSLLATRLLARAREVFQVEISLRAVFESPTIAGLAAAIDAAMLEGGDRLAALERRRDSGSTAPLSFTQECRWPLATEGAPSSLVTPGLVLVFDHALDATFLRRALTELVRRHEALRSTVSVTDEQRVQVVWPAVEVALEIQEVEEGQIADPTAIASQLEKRMIMAAERPALPFRVEGFRLPDGRFALLLGWHPMFTDGFSQGIVIAELGALYGAAACDAVWPLAAPPLQYVDFAAWQRGAVPGPLLDRHVAFWTEALRGAPSEITFSPVEDDLVAHPLERRRPELTLRGEVVEELRMCSRRHGLTQHMVLLAAWQLLLARVTGRRDIVVDTLMQARNRAVTQGMVGCFEVLAPLRTRIPEDLSGVELLSRVRDVVVASAAHQDLPFSLVATHAGLSPNRNIAFFHESSGFNLPSFGGVALVSVARAGDDHTAAHEVALRVVTARDRIEATLEYAPTVVGARTAGGWLAGWAEIVRRLASCPDQPVSAIARDLP